MQNKRYSNLAISLLLGVLFTMAFSFNYQMVEDASGNVITDYLSSSITWLKGYGAGCAIIVLAIAYCIYGTLNRLRAGTFVFRWYHYASALFFGIFNYFGLLLYHVDKLALFYNKTWVIVSIPLVLSYSSIFLLAEYWAFYLFDRWNCFDGKSVDCRQPFIKKHTWAAFTMIILLCWLPWIISYYPASMDWDVYRQLASFENVTYYAHSNHDPWFSSCVLGTCYELGKKLGSENFGIFIYIAFRDVCMAIIYARVAFLLYKSKIPSFVSRLTLLYFSITPVWGAYAKHGFKDSFAAALFCATITEMVLVCLDIRDGKLTIDRCVSFAFISFLSSAFRGNVIYALLPGVVLLTVFVFMRKSKTNAVVLTLGCIVFLLFNYSITHFGGIRPANKEEALSLPFQISARLVRDHYDEITEEERTAINGYLNCEIMAYYYDPLVSDPVKNNANIYASPEAQKECFNTLGKLAGRYPITSLEGFVASTYGYYSFTPKHDYTAGNWNANMTIFNWIKVDDFNPWFPNFDYIHNIIFDTMRTWLHSWAQVWDRLPLVSITDTIAAYSWLVFLLGLWLITRKRWLFLIPVLCVVLMIGTCMASPVNDCFRYYSPAAASVPVLLLLIPKSKVNMADLSK